MTQQGVIELKPRLYELTVETSREGPSKTLVVHVEPTDVADPGSALGHTLPVSRLLIDEVPAQRVEHLGTVSDHETMHIELAADVFELVLTMLEADELAAIQLRQSDDSIVPDITHVSFRSRSRPLGSREG